jgi:hypothetical protein
MNITHESLGPLFDKWHLNHSANPSPDLPDDCRPVIHRLDVDTGPPHDHPWGFHTFCLRGGYEEEIFTYGPSPYHAGSQWFRERRLLRPGEARYVPAGTIHRVVRLLDGPCFTCAIYGPAEREVRFYPEALGGNRNEGADDGIA